MYKEYAVTALTSSDWRVGGKRYIVVADKVMSFIKLSALDEWSGCCFFSSTERVLLVWEACPE